MEYLSKRVSSLVVVAISRCSIVYSITTKIKTLQRKIFNIENEMPRASITCIKLYCLRYFFNV